MPLPSATRYSQAQHCNAGVVYISGNFTFNGSGAPDAAQGKPFNVAGTDLTRSSTGVYVLTVPGSGTVDILSATFTLEDTAKHLVHRISARDDSARTIELTFMDQGTPSTTTDPAVADPTDGAILHVFLVVADRPL